jgi:hypothetical protein
MLLISLRKLPKKYFRRFGIYRGHSVLRPSFLAADRHQGATRKYRHFPLAGFTLRIEQPLKPQLLKADQSWRLNSQPHDFLVFSCLYKPKWTIVVDV